MDDKLSSGEKTIWQNIVLCFSRDATTREAKIFTLSALLCLFGDVLTAVLPSPVVLAVRIAVAIPAGVVMVNWQIRAYRAYRISKSTKN